MFFLSRLIITVLVLLTVGLMGCGGATTRLFSKPISESPYVTYQEWGPNRDIAVMPLVNVAKDKDAGLKARELLITELYASGAFKDVVDEGEMLEVMKKLKVRETDSFGKDTIKTLGDNLGVQAIIFGTVSEYTERSSKGALFAVSLRMVDVETGSILWVGNASKEGGGSISEALGLSDGPTVIDVARDVLAGLVDDLASEIKHRKVEIKKDEGAAVAPSAASAAGKKELPQDAKSGEKGVAVQQAGPVSSPTVKSTSAGMVSFPLSGGK